MTNLTCPLCGNELDDTERRDGWLFEGMCRIHGLIRVDVEVPGGFDALSHRK